MQIVTHTVEGGNTRRSWACRRAGTTTAGPIFAVSCGTENEDPAMYVLTQKDVASVVIGRGAPVRTSANSTLPDGLRAAALEARGYEPRRGFKHCPTVTPFDSSGRAIPTRTAPSIRLVVRPPYSTWAHPDKPRRGVCALTATKLAPGFRDEKLTAREVHSGSMRIVRLFQSDADLALQGRKSPYRAV